MQVVRTAKFVGLAVAVSLVFTGCVGKKRYNTQIEKTSARLASVESGIETNEKRVADLGRETDQKLAEVRSAADKAQSTGAQALSRADAAAAAAARAAQGKLLWTVKLTDDRVKFMLGKSMLPDDAAAALDDLARKVKSYGKAVYIEVEGHTDSTGSESHNITLGAKRAVSVRDYLASAGVPLHAMSTISYGEGKPNADNSSKEGRAQNRRVVVRVLE